MELNVKYLFIKGFNLILVSHHDTLGKLNIENVLTEFEANPVLNEFGNVLIDVRDADISAKLDELKEASILAHSTLKKSKIEKFAILYDIPQLNKVVEFVKAYPQSSKFQVFDNLEGAMHWLKIPAERKSQLEIKMNYLVKF